MVNFISNLWNRKARSRLEQAVEEVKPVFQTSLGRKAIVWSICYSEFPLLLSEPVFGVNSKEILLQTALAEERIEFLKKMFLQQSTPEINRQYLDYVDSATVTDFPSDCIIFHGHFRNSLVNKSLNAPNFSSRDKKFAQKQPLGLVEYFLMDSSNPDLYLLSQLSLCYQKQVKTFLRLQIYFHQDGSYSSTDGEIEQSGMILPVIKLTDNLTKVDLDDPLMDYVLKHAVQKLYMEKSSLTF